MIRTASEIAANLLGKLWEKYLSRVSYARVYNDLVIRKGGRVVPDHVGFRSFNTHTGEQPEGIQSIRHIFGCLGYHAGEKYSFPKKHIKAVCLEPDTAGLPKVFVSQIDVQQIPLWAQHLLPEVLADTPYLLSEAGIELLSKLGAHGDLPAEAADILETELIHYFRRPWKPPQKNTVLKLNDISHYAAWTLLHGNRPSHFAILVNMQEISAWPDLETTCNALREKGLPMKEKIEGERDSALQQSATYAVREEVSVRGDDGMEKLTWTYAYLELIQRGYVRRGDQSVLFPGFIESQESQLYNMTVTLDN